LKVVGGRVRMGFYFYPLNSEWLIGGFGPDISLRYDKLTHQYNDITSKDKVTSIDLGLGLRVKLPLIEDKTAQGRGTNKFIVISYRAFAQRVLRNCKNVGNTDATFEGCRDAKALQTWEDYLVHGGGYEASVGLEFRF